MRNTFCYALMGLALLLTGCNLDSIPPSDGIYSGTLGTDNVYAVIDSSGHGLIVDTTNPSVTRFTISSVDDKGNFTVPTNTYAGAGGTTVDSTPVTVGSISGTVNGSSSGVDGGTNRNTITGNLTPTIGGASQSFSLTYLSNLYEDNVVPLSTIVTSTNGSTPTLTYTYNYGSATSNAVTLSLTTTQQTTSSTSITGYAFTGTDTANCSYTGTISMPSSSYNAFYLSMTVGGTNCAFPGSFTGLAYVNGTSPTILTLEYDNGGSTAIAANAALNN